MAWKVSPTRSTWQNMIQRCSNPRAINYSQYGVRGIHVCDRWRKFTNFNADMGDKPAGKELDRIDNDKGYEPGNCRWASHKENSRNRRDNVRLTHNGETMTISGWAERLGVRNTVIHGRIKAGYPIDRVLGDKMKVHRRFITHDGTTDSVIGWSRTTGIPRRTIRNRMDWGWPIDKVLSR